jgi:hypothetical protein
MSVTKALIHTALKPLFKTWFDVVGAKVAAETRLSVVGGLYIQARDIRYTSVSIIFSFLCYRVRLLTV